MEIINEVIKPTLNFSRRDKEIKKIIEGIMIQMIELDSWRTLVISWVSWYSQMSDNMDVSGKEMMIAPNVTLFLATTETVAIIRADIMVLIINSKDRSPYH